jgi:hypothetical protein
MNDTYFSEVLEPSHPAPMQEPTIHTTGTEKAWTMFAVQKTVFSSVVFSSLFLHG